MEADFSVDNLPNFFLAGCQKSATSWLHRCFGEHPEIYVPEKHMVHFFDIHFREGLAWYQQFYADFAGEKAIGDTTVSYIREPAVPERIAAHEPNAKLIFSLRNPIDRAFSHYWHEKKKRKIAFKFEEVFANYDLYQSWVVPGFYYRHLTRFYDCFPEEQILVILVDDIANDPGATVRRVFTFLDVEPGFVPPSLHKRANAAWYRPIGFERLGQDLYAVLTRLVRTLLPAQVRRVVKERYLGGETPGRIRSEYEEGMKPETRAQLREIFRPENEKLAALLGRDLSAWV